MESHVWPGLHRSLHPPIPTTGSHSPDLAGVSRPHLGHTKD